MPLLSVVQSVYGYYEIGLGEEKLCKTEEGGAFIAPAGISQQIIHHNGTKGYFEAQWIFMNITVNNLFAFEDVFNIPTLISAEYKNELYNLISTVKNSSNICEKYAAAYKITDVLISLSTLKEVAFDNSVAFLKKYIDENYSKNITTENLADIAICSVASLYRIFQKHFQLSPHNYINKIRVEKAAVLLEHSNHSVTEISKNVGFDDPVYFSKLFKEKYQCFPKNYRNSLYSTQELNNLH